MASRKTRLRPIWQDSPERCGCPKIRWHGSDACAASGNDGPARHQRRALSSWRPIGRATSRWKLRRVGDHGNGAARLAVAHGRRRKESPRIPRAGCDLRIDSIDSWASRAAQERATFKAAGCCRVRDRDGIWRRALDERYIARESAWTKLPRCKRYENLADQIRAINFSLRLTHSTSS